jgi:hypothetical protein
MNRRKINPLVLVGLIGIFTVGSNFGMQMYRAFGGNRDIWWTPRELALPLEDTENSFSMNIGGRSIDEHLRRGSLFVRDSSGDEYSVVPRDVEVRMNNWFKVRSSILASAVLSGVFFGGAIALFIAGIIQVLSRKGEQESRQL